MVITGGNTYKHPNERKSVGTIAAASVVAESESAAAAVAAAAEMTEATGAKNTAASASDRRGRARKGTKSIKGGIYQRARYHGGGIEAYSTGRETTGARDQGV